MPDIFISYAREDRERIEPLAEALEAHGWSVFWDRDIPAGATWRSHIGQALGAARCVIVAWSESSIGSTWVSEEADEAKSRGVLVPILFDAVTPPIGFRSIQAADLSDWTGRDDSPDFSQLLSVIAALLEGRSQVVAGGGTPSRARWPRLRRKTLLRVGTASLVVLLAFVVTRSLVTPAAIDCDPIEQGDAFVVDPDASSFWLELEELSCSDAEGFFSGLVLQSGVDEPYLVVNDDRVWSSEQFTCPSQPFRFERSERYQPIELEPGENRITLWESDQRGESLHDLGLTRDDIIGQVRVQHLAGRYKCRFQEEFADYEVTWSVTQGRPE